MLKELYHNMIKRIFSILLGKKNNRTDRKNRLIQDFCEAYEEKTENFLTVNIRPKFADNLPEYSLQTTSIPEELGIVIQGPIYSKDNFTIETIKYYKKIFPNQKIILSTWEGLDEEYMRILRELDCDVVLSKNIDNYGMCNVNYQITTSLAGVKRALSCGAKYVIKTRTDQRIYKRYTFEYLKSLLEIHKVSDECKTKIKGKIVTVNGVKGQMFAPYWIQDFFYFGYTEDMLNLFDIPFDGRNYHSYDEYKMKNNISNCSIFENSIMEVPEVYITKKYLEKYEKLDNSVVDSWNLITKYFICISNQDIDLYWIKYNRKFYENIVNNTFNGDRYYSDAEMAFTYNNYINILTKKIYENNQYDDFGKRLIH